MNPLQDQKCTRFTDQPNSQRHILKSVNNTRPISRLLSLASSEEALHEGQDKTFLPDAFVGELRRRNQFETLELPEMSRISEHVDVEQLGHVPAAPHGVLFTERVADVRAFLVDDGALVGRCSGCSDLTNQVSESHRCRHLDLFKHRTKFFSRVEHIQDKSDCRVCWARFSFPLENKIASYQGFQIWDPKLMTPQTRQLPNGGVLKQ